jgi:hypothetical protein
MRELSQSGVIGDATVATKEKGDRLLESLSDGWVQAIQDIYKSRVKFRRWSTLSLHTSHLGLRLTSLATQTIKDDSRKWNNCIALIC